MSFAFERTILKHKGKASEADGSLSDCTVSGLGADSLGAWVAAALGALWCSDANVFNCSQIR